VNEDSGFKMYKKGKNEKKKTTYRKKMNLYTNEGDAGASLEKYAWRTAGCTSTYF
jgi:hypothetical protein